jgi:hypothetical protein
VGVGVVIVAIAEGSHKFFVEDHLFYCYNSRRQNTEFSSQLRMLTFAHPTQLESWLHAHGVDTALWGRGTAKSLEDLWTEVAQGESLLVDEPPLRRVQVVELHIRRDGRLLVEAAQELASGHVRQRNQPPAEKLKPGEWPTDAARRCLKEELGVDQEEQIRFAAAPVETREIIKLSPSFPGLVTVFTVHRVVLAVSGLPAEAFATVNAAHHAGDPVVRHFWRWTDDHVAGIG